MMKNLLKYGILSKLKKSPFFLVFCLPFFFVSCDNSVNLPYEFKDQEVQGRIQGQPWEIQDAVARFSLSNEDTLLLQLNDTTLGLPCDYLISNAGARFTIPCKTGIYILSSKAIQYQSVSIYEGGTSLEALAGAIEITLIDTANAVIEGKIDATYDGQNQLNGHFSAHWCF